MPAMQSIKGRKFSMLLRSVWLNAQRLKVRMFLDIQRKPGDTSSSAEIVRRFVHRFQAEEWPQGISGHQSYSMTHGRYPVIAPNEPPFMRSALWLMGSTSLSRRRISPKPLRNAMWKSGSWFTPALLLHASHTSSKPYLPLDTFSERSKKQLASTIRLLNGLF